MESNQLNDFAQLLIDTGFSYGWEQDGGITSHIFHPQTGQYVGDFLKSEGFSQRTVKTNQFGEKTWVYFSKYGVELYHRDLSEYETSRFVIQAA